MSSSVPRAVTSPVSSDRVVSARGLSKCYPAYRHPSDALWQALLPRRKAPEGVWAVRGVDLEVARGETVGVIGRNGSGKSTLLQMICGTMQPTEGELEVRGRVAALLDLGAGFNRDFTGRENIRLNGSILGLTQQEVEDRLARVIEFADIGPYIDRPVRYYSSGMFARLAFAVAIHVDPDLLVVDEILSVGDEAFQRKCFARIEEIRSTGAAILFVSHAISAVVELCDRALYIDEGEILFDGKTKDAVTLYHRVLYAPSERAADLRSQLRAGRETPSDDPVVPIRASTPGREASQETSLFDPELTPKSTVVYDALGARISGPRLLSPEGRRINCVESGQRCVFEYDVGFEKTCFDVRLHMLVKRISGLELGGGVFPAISEPGADFEAGSLRRVSFEFECHLLPGTYFLNCGVTGNGGKQLHRIVDALMFRVLPIHRPTVFGLVNFGCTTKLRPIPDQA